MTSCASHTYKIYDGPERLSSQTVTVLNSPKYAFWSFIRIDSVDGLRVKSAATGYTVLPGAHWYQVWVDRHAQGAMFFLDAYYTEAVCGFSFESAPGTTDQIMDVDNGQIVQDKERKMFKATTVVEQHLAEGNSITLRIPTECVSWDFLNAGSFKRNDQSAKGGFLCRDNVDCLNKGETCVHETAYSYGICSQPDKLQQKMY
jgi:hypothetical protein